MPPSADDRTRDGLIESLVGDLEPVRPVRPGRVFLAFLAIESLVVAGASYSLGVRTDFLARLADPVYLGVVAVLAVAAAWCASIAIRLSVPGRDVSGRTGALLLATPLLLATAVVLVQPWGGAWPGWHALMTGCLQCIGVTAVSAAVPWIVTMVVLSRLAPLNELRVGLFAGVSAFLVGALVTEVHCAMGSGYHLAVGHYLPVALLAALTCALAAAILRLRLRGTDLDARG